MRLKSAKPKSRKSTNLTSDFNIQSKQIDEDNLMVPGVGIAKFLKPKDFPASKNSRVKIPGRVYSGISRNNVSIQNKPTEKGDNFNLTFGDLLNKFDPFGGNNSQSHHVSSATNFRDAKAASNMLKQRKAFSSANQTKRRSSNTSNTKQNICDFWVLGNPIAASEPMRDTSSPPIFLSSPESNYEYSYKEL